MHYEYLGESFHTSIYNLLAKFVFDTAENEPLKVTDSEAGNTPKLVVSRPLKGYLVGKGAASSSQKKIVIRRRSRKIENMKKEKEKKT